MNRVSRRSAAEAAEALLEAGRTEPVLDYDVELGLARHQDWLRHDAPVPEWAGTGLATATKSISAVVIKTIVSTVLVGALATAAWQARSFLQPSATIVPSSPGVLAAPPAMPDATASEAEAAMPPIPIPVPDQALQGEHPVRRAVRADAADKRTTRIHRAHKANTRADGAATRAAVLETRAAAAPNEVAATEQRSNAEVTAVRAATAASEGAAVEHATRSELAASAESKSVRAAQKPQPGQEPKAQQPDDLVEMQQVATAEQLLERAPARALALVQQGDQRFARGYFQQERAYIAIMALIRLGRIDEARARAASFAKQFPALPYGARIRHALDAAPRENTP